jgi:hypothetical protein
VHEAFVLNKQNRMSGANNITFKIPLKEVFMALKL